MSIVKNGEIISIYVVALLYTHYTIAQHPEDLDKLQTVVDTPILQVISIYIVDT